MVSLSSKACQKGPPLLGSVRLGRIKVVLSSIFFKKGLVTFHLILAVFYLPPLAIKFQILVQKFQRQIRVSCVAQHHLAQHTPHSCGVYHIWFPSNQIPVQLHFILDVRDKVWPVYRVFKHQTRGGCTVSKATDQILPNSSLN